jgi:HlyD family secretion protein
MHTRTERFEGRVQQIRKAAEVVQNVVTYTAIVSAPNPDLLLLPGMTAVLRVVTNETENSLKVSNQALRIRPAGVAAESTAISGTSPPANGTVWIVDDSGAAPWTRQPSAERGMAVWGCAR